MIGILCSSDKEKKYINHLHSLFQDLRGRNDDSIVVFTLAAINFNEGTVTGSLITGKKIETVKVPIPSIIFNLSLQRDNDGIKARRLLEEMEGVELINHINKFNQLMIMEILSSSDKLGKYLLPYHIYKKKDSEFTPEDEQCYIAMPSRGASLSRVIYAHPQPDSDRVKGNRYFKKGHICDYIDALLYQDTWIFIEVPDLTLYHYSPVVVRCYLQKSTPQTWNVIARDVNPEIVSKRNINFREIEKASLMSIDYINCFLTSLGHCFMDFIMDADGNPYFLHLGGFEQNFISKKQDTDFHKKYYYNMIKLARYYSRMQKGG